MDTLYLSSTVNHGADRRFTSGFKKPSLASVFSKTKHSDDWHSQIDFTANDLRPSNPKFQYQLLQKHTNEYLRKKRKITQADADIRLAILIESHEPRDVALAACAHAMSPTSVRAMLNVELNVAPSTFYGLGEYLECLIAARKCNSKAISEVEAIWAENLLAVEFAKSPQLSAPGKYLEGICRILRENKTPDLNNLPDYVLLARRAFKDFATYLEGLKLKCQWVTAHAAVRWMAELMRTPSVVRPPGHVIPEHLLDENFPLWRAWAGWRPEPDRITFLDGVDGKKRALLPDLLALEGPDFVTGMHATLRDGLIAQYGAAKPLVRFRSLIIDVEEQKRENLQYMLERTATTLNTALKAGDVPFNVFVQLTISRPITTEALQLLEALAKISDTPKNQIHLAVLEVYLAQSHIGGRHILSLQEVICGLDDTRGEDLRKIVLRPWLVQGLEKCTHECQTAIRIHIENGLPWTHLAMEFYQFCVIVKGSKNVLPLLDDVVQKQLDVLPEAKQLRSVMEIYKATGGDKSNDDAQKVDDPVKDSDASHKSTGSSSRVPVPAYLVGEAKPKNGALQFAIEAFCIDRLMECGTVSHASEKTVNAIVKVWENTTAADTDRRELALVATQRARHDFILRCRCLDQIASDILPHDFVSTLLYILKRESREPEQVPIDLVKLLARIDNVEAKNCWKSMLYAMLETDNHPGIFKVQSLIDYSLEEMDAISWTQFMRELASIFPEITSNPKASPPPILQTELHLWIQQLDIFIPTIKKLEAALGEETEAVQVILRGGEGLWVEHLVRILQALGQGGEVESLMQKVVGQLTVSGKERKAQDIAQCLETLLGITPECLEACGRVWNIKHGIPPYGVEIEHPPATTSSLLSTAVAEVILAGWLQDPLMGTFDKVALETLASLLNLEIYQYGVPKEKLEEATEYFESLEDKIIAEAERLQAVQKALKFKDPIGTAQLLEKLEIEDISPLDEEIEALPASVIDAVERHGENEIEISFPLTSMTDLQRDAMGIPTDARTLLVRLWLYITEEMPPEFCVHFDNDFSDRAGDIEHDPWICLADSITPVESFCRGKRTLFTWQLSRSIHRYLRLKNLGIADLHAFIKMDLEELAHLCISCGEDHNSGRHIILRRSAPCYLPACIKLWNGLPLDVRVPEIRTDIFAVDLLLTTVYAAAMTGRMELLPNCPMGTMTVSNILNTLPKLSVLRDAVNLSAVLQSYHKDAEKLILWVCTHFRGFISTAKGICKIPSFPSGTHQFVLANANHQQEADYASTIPRVSSPVGKVLFHGTSLDRLPAILAMGLRVCSGTSLQRTGAAHGKGIYMAEDPSTSIGYSPSAVSWRNSGLSNMKLLLGCEVMGTGGRNVSNGIHVISDEKTVMLRYIFLLTGSSHVPIANHVVHAMGSAMSALRSGAV